MRKICFITGTRADYGIMVPVMRKIQESPDATLQVIATNMHLSERHGMTVREIVADGFNIDARIPCMREGDSANDTVKSMGTELLGLADALSDLKPDLIVILGDRYEMLAAASAALIFRIPVAHLHGGEITEGAYDDAMRHAITKLSSYHFASSAEYADHIIQMGEDPSRVFAVGSPAADTISSTSPDSIPSLSDLEEYIDFDLGYKFVVATFHPVTTAPGEEREQTEEFLQGIDTILKEGWKILFTMPNSDTGGDIVAETITRWADDRKDKVKTIASLGRLRFYAALTYASAIVGNSSSGLIEAPSFGIPTLNVGDRQKGRTRGESVLDVPCNAVSVADGLRTILSPEFRAMASHACNPYHIPGTVTHIADTLLHIPLSVKSGFRTLPAGC